MGDRVSICFNKDGEQSVTLFSHWRGKDLVKEANKYVKMLKEETTDNNVGPLKSLEPCTVMVDFIRHLTSKMVRVDSDLYLGRDELDGDNSDNGHFEIKL
jgi:hypothetical protein